MSQPAVTDQDAVKRIVSAHDPQPGSLIHVLQDLQAELNWLPRPALEETARYLGLPPAKVYAVATYFEAFSLEPRGEHICTVCMGTACHVRGAPRVLDKLARDLEVQVGQTREDMKVTLEQVNCVGACALGPLVIADGEYHGNMTAKKVDKLIKNLDISSEEAIDDKD